jgi:hypothetical protein
MAEPEQEGASRAPFQTAGDLAQWQMVYALLVPLAFGDIITYEQLSYVLGRDFVDDRQPLYRARQELGRLNHRWLDNVPNVGYRVVESREHIKLIRKEKLKMARRGRQGLRIADAADLRYLTTEERGRLDRLTVQMSMLTGMVLRQQQQINRINDVLIRAGLMAPPSRVIDVPAHHVD